MFSVPHIVHSREVQIQLDHVKGTAEERFVEDGQLAHEARTLRSKVATP